MRTDTESVAKETASKDLMDIHLVADVLFTLTRYVCNLYFNLVVRAPDNIRKMSFKSLYLHSPYL